MPALIGDTGAQAHIFGNTDELLNIRNLKRTIRLKGVGNGYQTISRIGIHPDFGEVYIADEYNGPNLISINKLQLKLYSATIPSPRVILLIPNSLGRKTYIAEAQNDNISYMRAIDADPRGEDMSNLVFETNSRGGENVKATFRATPDLVRGGLKAYVSKVSTSDRVWILHELLSHASERSLCEAINQGEFDALEISAEDVKRAGLHDCTACIRGKMRAGF